MSLPQQRAQFAQMLSQQALQNRGALFGAGQQALANERQFRLQSGTRFGEQTTESGGGFGGFLTGALGGAGAGLGVANQLAGNRALNSVGDFFNRQGSGAGGGQGPGPGFFGQVNPAALGINAGLGSPSMGVGQGTLIPPNLANQPQFGGQPQQPFTGVPGLFGTGSVPLGK